MPFPEGRRNSAALFRATPPPRSALSDIESHPPGTISWVDLQSSRPEQARAFYAALFGWEYDVGGEETGHYAMARKDGRQSAGIGGLPPGAAGMPSMWTPYFASEGVEASLERVVAAGGTVLAPAMDVLAFGRMAVCADPSGAVFGFWQAGTHKGFGVIDEPGAFAWGECLSRDVGKARAFYVGLLGFPEKQMPGMQYWTLQAGEKGAFGLMAMPAALPASAPSYWNIYFAVPDADAAAATVTRLGGRVHWSPSDTPFGRLVSVADPFGAAFMLMSRPR